MPTTKTPAPGPDPVPALRKLVNDAREALISAGLRPCDVGADHNGRELRAHVYVSTSGDNEAVLVRLNDEQPPGRMTRDAWRGELARRASAAWADAGISVHDCDDRPPGATFRAGWLGELHRIRPHA